MFIEGNSPRECTVSRYAMEIVKYRPMSGYGILIPFILKLQDKGFLRPSLTRMNIIDRQKIVREMPRVKVITYQRHVQNHENICVGFK